MGWNYELIETVLNMAKDDKISEFLKVCGVKI